MTLTGSFLGRHNSFNLTDIMSYPDLLFVPYQDSLDLLSVDDDRVGDEGEAIGGWSAAHYKSALAKDGNASERTRALR